MRDRMNVYFPPELLKQIGDLADCKKLSRSAIVEAAVASFLSPDGADKTRGRLCPPARATIAAGSAAGTGSRRHRRDAGAVRPLLADYHPAFAGRPDSQRTAPFQSSAKRIRTVGWRTKAAAHRSIGSKISQQLQCPSMSQRVRHSLFTGKNLT